MGGSSEVGGVFPPTRWSAVVAARSGDPGERKLGLDRIAEAYWRPVYKLLRLRWGRSDEDARDLAQEFFAKLVEGDTLARFDPAKGRLRTFLRTCLDALVMNDDRDRSRLKRGGDRVVVSLDGAHEIVADHDADAIFEAEWARSLFAMAIARFRRECEQRGRGAVYEVFRRYDVEDADPRPTYAEIAAAVGLKTTDVTNHLSLARREMRRITLETLREMTASEDEFRSEARTLLGIEPPR